MRLAGPMTSTTNQILYRYLYQIDIVFLSTAFIFVSNNIGICIGIGIYKFCTDLVEGGVGGGGAPVTF